MQTRVAIVSIIVENPERVGELNALLHEYSPYILGRMGIPHLRHGISIISLAMDAPQDQINALAGRLGRLEGITAKTVYSARSYPAE